MATKLDDAALEDIANSLTDLEVVPAKLQCVNPECGKVAFNAWKLPCCDQNLCNNCYASNPEECPGCYHRPLNREDAKPAKGLRLTVAQFLKNIKKKREKVHAAQGGDITPTTAEASTPTVEPIPASAVAATLEPAEFMSAPVDASDVPDASVSDAAPDAKQNADTTAARVADEDAELQELEATTTVPQADNAVHSQNDQDIATDHNDNDEDDAGSDVSDIEIITGDEDKTAANPWGEAEEEYEDEQSTWTGQNGHQQIGGQGYGFQGGDGDMFSNMNPNDMMQMMMQQMGNMSGWPNMMNMSGMGMNMNPMDMMAAFNMQGMGGMNTNMMNMNGMMDMNFFNTDFGSGWNGQQMNGGDFGASAGYYPDGGYNQSSHQGNYPPQMSHHNRHQNQQFSKNNSYNQQPGSFRGSQRGYGRGYHNNQGFHGRSHSQSYTGLSDGPPPNAPTGPKAQREAIDTSAHSNSKSASDRQQETAPENGTNRDITNENQQEVDNSARETERTQAESANEDIRNEDGKENRNDYWKDTNGTSFEGHQDQRYQRGGVRGRGAEGRGGWRGRGGWKDQASRGTEMQPSPIEDPIGIGVEGAPSGPKAMREPSTRGKGGFHGRNQSFSQSSGKHDEYGSRTPANVTTSYIHPSPSVSRPRSRERSLSKERSRSPSRRQSNRRRSRTPSSDSEYERKKERKRRRKHEEEIGSRRADDYSVDDPNEDKYRSSRREHERHRSSRSQRETSRERRKRRRRSRSPGVHDNEQQDVNGDAYDSKEKERRREKDKYRDRSKDRDRHREKDRDKDREKRRASKRDRSASPDSQHRSSHRRDKEKDKEYEREKELREHREQYDKERESRRASAASISKTTRTEVPNVQKQLEQGFRVHGRSKEKERDRLKAEAAAVAKTEITAQEPVDAVINTAKMQPPTGPRADRGSGASSKFKLDLAHLNAKTPSRDRGQANPVRRTSQTVTPTSAVAPKEAAPAVIDPYEEERRKAQEARIAKENSRRAGAPPITKKRSWADIGDEESASRGSFDWEREKKKAKGRKMSYKYEDDGDIGRGEGERESARYR